MFITIKNYDPFKILSSNNPNLISFTSGTESLPKGVVRDINSYINNAFNFSNEIYNERIKIKLLSRLRDGLDFNNSMDLKTQLQQDEKKCKSILGIS